MAPAAIRSIPRAGNGFARIALVGSSLLWSHGTRATAVRVLPSGEDGSQSAQKRLNRSKIDKASARGWI